MSEATLDTPIAPTPAVAMPAAPPPPPYKVISS